MAPKEEVPLKGFSLEKRLSWKAVNPPLQPSQSERSDVSVSSGTSEKGTSDGIGGHHRGGASIRHRAAESGLSGVPSLKSGYDLTSPVSVRTRVRVWEEIAREGPPARGFVVGDGSEQKAEKKGLVLTQKANQEEVFVDVAGKTEGYQTSKELNEIDELPDISEWDISEWGESDMESERGGKPEVGVSKSFGLTRLGASESADEMEKLRAAETEPRGVKKPDGVETNGNGTEKLEAGDLFGREVSETEAVVRASDRDQNGVQKLEAGKFPVRGCWGRWAVYLSNRRAQTAMLVLWLAANLGVFAYKYLYSMDNPEYHIVGFWFCIARGAGEALKLNLALILLPVSRLTTTFLWNRARGRGARAPPLQSATTFHQIIGLALLVWTLLHTAVHLAVTYPRLAAANRAQFLGLMGGIYGDAQPDYWALLKTQTSVSGFMVIAIMLVAYPLAAPCVRRCKTKILFLRLVTGFEAFWYTHLLLLLIFPLAVVHGSQRPIDRYPTTSTRMWIAAPLLFYALDRGFRVGRIIWRNRKKAACVKAESLPGDVLALTIARPPGFTYRAGQYVFINCPQVSVLQWHPFSLTSAPSDRLLRVHIRTSMGDWTSAVGRRFDRAIRGDHLPAFSPDLEAGRLPRVADKDSKKPPGLVPPVSFPRLLLDGPYAAPPQDFTRFKVVMLIGAGIGVTPFASVIREWLRQLSPQADVSNEDRTVSAHSKRAHEASTRAPSRAGHVAAPEVARRKTPNLGRVEKVYLHWVARDRAAAAWFEQHLADLLPSESTEKRLEMTTYLTRQSALDAAAAPRAHGTTAAGPIANDNASQVFVKRGRPQWDRLFATARENHPNVRVGVFYCGTGSLNSTLSRMCCKHSVNGTRFDFFKENY